jgi:hypothetical protein
LRSPRRLRKHTSKLRYHKIRNKFRNIFRNLAARQNVGHAPEEGVARVHPSDSHPVSRASCLVEPEGITPHHTTPRHTTPHHTRLYHTPPSHTKPRYTTPHFTTPCHTTPRPTTPHQATPHDTTPHHTKYHHTTPHQEGVYWPIMKGLWAKWVGGGQWTGRGWGLGNAVAKTGVVERLSPPEYLLC